MAAISREDIILGSLLSGRRPTDPRDKKTGVPSNDVDRSGKGQAVEFAQPKKGLALTYKDFFVI